MASIDIPNSTEAYMASCRAFDKANPPRNSEERRRRREERIALEKRTNNYMPGSFTVQRGCRQMIGVRMTPTEFELARKRGEIVGGGK